jgi:hypothetical protein
MNLITVAISDAASGASAIIAAQGATTCIRIRRIALCNAVATAQSFKLQDGATDLTGVIALPTSVGGFLFMDSTGGDPLFVLSQNSAFNLNLTAATSVTGFVQYTLG